MLSRFAARFHHIEEVAGGEGRRIESLTLAEMETLWLEAKKLD